MICTHVFVVFHSASTCVVVVVVVAVVVATDWLRVLLIDIVSDA